MNKSISAQQHQSFKVDNQDWLKDQLSSLCYRLRAVQNGLNQKIDRTECLGLLQHKSSLETVNRLFKQVQQTREWDKAEQEQNLRNKYKNDDQCVKRLMRRMQHSKEDKFPDEVESQMQKLWLLMLQKFQVLQRRQQHIQKMVCEKHTRALMLNNEVCAKMQSLQQQIQSIQRFPTKKHIANKNIHKATSQQQHTLCSEEYSTIRFDILCQNFSNMQKQLSKKLNIQDLLSVLRPTLQIFEQKLEQLQTCIQQTSQSTQKILLHQCQINQQIYTGMKIGYWHSYHQNQLLIWDREILNLLPQGYHYQPNTTNIIIKQQGAYIIKLHALETFVSQWNVYINNQKCQVQYEQIIRVGAQTTLTVQSVPSLQTFLILQKL